MKRADINPHLHQIVLGHSVGYAADFVVAFEDLIVDLKFLSAVVPVKTEQVWLVTRGQFNYQLLSSRPVLT